MTNIFVPNDFDVPENYTTRNFYIAVLEPSVAELDYDAVMSSKESLRSIFERKTDWPEDSMTLEFNITDLKQHEREFKLRQAFAYTVLTPEKDRCIGCIYIDPTKVKPFDCEVYFWVRDDVSYLDNEIYNFVSSWLSTDWPFEKIAFPGRDIDWSEWGSM